MALEKICCESDLKEGCAVARDFPHVRVSVFRHQGGLYAIDDICPHRQAYLCEGDLDSEGFVTCPLHAWAFNLKTGAMRGQAAVRIRTFPVQVQDGDVLVDVPAPQKPPSQ